MRSQSYGVHPHGLPALVPPHSGTVSGLTRYARIVRTLTQAPPSRSSSLRSLVRNWPPAATPSRPQIPLLVRSPPPRTSPTAGSGPPPRSRLGSAEPGLAQRRNRVFTPPVRTWFHSGLKSAQFGPVINRLSCVGPLVGPTAPRKLEALRIDLSGPHVAPWLSTYQPVSTLGHETHPKHRACHGLRRRAGHSLLAVRMHIHLPGPNALELSRRRDVRLTLKASLVVSVPLLLLLTCS